MGDPYWSGIKAETDEYKASRNFRGLVRESELPIIPIGFQGQHNLERGKGQYLNQVFKEEKEGRLRSS
jgi:hypothetical protein